MILSTVDNALIWTDDLQIFSKAHMLYYNLGGSTGLFIVFYTTMVLSDRTKKETKQ